MASEPPFGSHNPFRRKGSTSSVTSAATPLPSDPADPSASIFSRQRPPANRLDFARALESLPKTDAPPPSTTFQKKKPVKKVRVQSPPPSSPESTSAEHTYPKYPLPPRDDDYESSDDSPSVNGDREDPFQNEGPPISQETETDAGGMDAFNSRFPAAPFGRAGGGPPPNPFQQTLEDMERAAADGGQAASEQSAGQGKVGMDVEAFKRLLLTGQGPRPNAPALSATAGDGGSTTETSSISKHSSFEAAHSTQETPRTSHENSEPEADVKLPAPPPQRMGSRKKPPPPPPATRHGKLIKVELKDKNAQGERRPSTGQIAGSPISPRRPSSTSPTDVNKPLPPPPNRSEDDAKDSIFDTEAAGKIPEVDIDPDADVVPPPRPPTPPNAAHSASTPVQNPTSTLRKPAPPPRRQGHGRSESKSIPTDPSEELATTPPRSSLESQRSRSSSLRVNLTGPAPPPPRRAASHRQSPSFSQSPSSLHQISPSYPVPASSGSPGSSDLPASYHQTDASSSSTSLSAPPVGPGSVGFAKFSPPPPPPQRNASLRKGANSRPPAPDTASRKSSGGTVPPPPPPRARGSSKGSMDDPTGLGRADSLKGRSEEAVIEEAEAPADTAASDKALKAMLADLDALQREVDAARAAAGGS